MQFISVLAAVFSVLVAVAALVFSISESRASRRHARLSVKPILSDDILIVPTEPRIGLFLRNCGVGPARITDWSLLIDGKPYRELGITDWSKLSEYLGLGDHTPVYGYFYSGQTLPVGEAVELFALDGKKYTPEIAKTVRQALRRQTIIIKYQSIYEDITETYIFDGVTRFKPEEND